MTNRYRSDVTSRPDEMGAVLARLTEAGRPWLALVPSGTAIPAAAATDVAAAATDVAAAATDVAAAANDVTVIDVTDLRAVPLTVNPFEPEPGCAVQAHADRLAALFEAAFRPPAAARAALRVALRQVYADCGWDLATGGALPGAAAPPGIPSITDLRRAAVAATFDLGCDHGMRAAVRGFLDAKLAPLWTGQAGRFLAGGHQADVAGLLRGKVMFTTGEVADDGAAAFLAGVLLVRLSEHLRARGTKPGPRVAVVIAIPPGRLRRLLDDIRSRGVEVIPAERAAVLTSAPPELRHPPSPPSDVPLCGRRSAACGPLCRQRPCSGYELHEATLRAGADGEVWLRLWVQALILAFLTGRPLPRAPKQLRASWPELDTRTRECLLATVVDATVSCRARALRHSYDPARLIAVAARAAASLLASAPAGTSPRAGHVWVIPQLRWLHEAERLCPLGQDRVCRDDIAPPLDFGLTGLLDWPGIQVGDRLDGLRRHRLSMERETNRILAMTALRGEDPSFDRDLAIASVGHDKQQRLRYAEHMLGTVRYGQEPGWLEVVLSWPSRLIRPVWEPDVREAATR